MRLQDQRQSTNVQDDPGSVSPIRKFADNVMYAHQSLPATNDPGYSALGGPAIQRDVNQMKWDKRTRRGDLDYPGSTGGYNPQEADKYPTPPQQQSLPQPQNQQAQQMQTPQQFAAGGLVRTDHVNKSYTTKPGMPVR
jgi:hypothetical protein